MYSYDKVQSINYLAGWVSNMGESWKYYEKNLWMDHQEQIVTLNNTWRMFAITLQR